jgi:hypothetical protein
MAHPDLEMSRQPGKHAIFFENLDRGLAKLPLVAGNYFPADALGDELETVADAKYRDSQLEKLGGKGRAAGAADRIRSSGKDHTDRSLLSDRLHGRRIRVYLAVYGKLANTARDELGILASKVQDNYSFVVNG